MSIVKLWHVVLRVQDGDETFLYVDDVEALTARDARDHLTAEAQSKGLTVHQSDVREVGS